MSSREEELSRLIANYEKAKEHLLQVQARSYKKPSDGSLMTELPSDLQGLTELDDAFEAESKASKALEKFRAT